MGCIIVYTLSKAFTKIVYNSAGHFMWNGRNFLTNCIFKLFNRLKAITFDLRYPQRKNRTDLNQVCQIILHIYIYIYIYIVCVSMCVLTTTTLCSTKDIICRYIYLEPVWEKKIEFKFV